MFGAPLSPFWPSWLLLPGGTVSHFFDLVEA
jgi:hypothetical protein